METSTLDESQATEERASYEGISFKNKTTINAEYFRANKTCECNFDSNGLKEIDKKGF